VPLIFDFRDALLKIHRYFIQSGIYEVLEYESTLELKDKSGKQATFKKNTPRKDNSTKMPDAEEVARELGVACQTE
jgi:hypothetical protein